MMNAEPGEVKQRGRRMWIRGGAERPDQVSIPATSQSPSTFSMVIVTQFL